MIFHGIVQKLKSQLNTPIEYSLPIGNEILPLNSLLGKNLSFDFSGNIFCNNCGKKTKKSYQQGYCFMCATTLARCDLCIVRPERCHFHLGTCREPDWAETHCMIPHIVYISNTSHLKVGVTRETQVPTRWIDQGATQALKIARVPSRFQAGLLEMALSKQISDKTDWRAMLKGDNQPLDLHAHYKALNTNMDHEPRFNNAGIEWLTDAPLTLQYPILEYPEKVKSISVEKEKIFSTILLGIKGQYLILEKGVLNVRNLNGYELKLSLLD